MAQKKVYNDQGNQNFGSAVEYQRKNSMVLKLRTNRSYQSQTDKYRSRYRLCKSHESEWLRPVRNTILGRRGSIEEEG